MRKLGNWTTFDCPTSKIDEALDFLTTRLTTINASVLHHMNPHESGEYPSFEIFIPEELAEFDEDDNTLPDDEYQLLFNAKDKITQVIDEIEKEYHKKFKDVL